MELADTSVWARKDLAQVRPWFVAAAEAGEIAVCDMVAMEILYSSRNAVELRRVEDALRAMPWSPIEASDWARARAVYRSLARRAPAFHRSVGNQDLLIAAAAERARVTLVHYDSDYETIASVTGQATRWVAPRGSL